MKKQLIAIAMVVVSIFVANGSMAGPWTDQDEEATQIATMIRGMVGNTFEEAMKDQYPKAEFEWGARTMPQPGKTMNYIIYVHTTTPSTDIGYHFFEFALNTINGNPVLEELYNIV